MAVINKTIINKPDMNYGIWAENGNVEIPSSEKVELGWIAEKPLNEQMNWVQNRQDAMLQYINQHGIVEWDNVTEYPINAFVAREGVVYKALSQNVDKDPTLNTAIWNVAFSTYQDFDSLRQDVKKIKDVDGYVSHYVRKNNPILTANAKGVGYSFLDNEATGLHQDGNKDVVIDGVNNARFRFKNVEDLSKSTNDVVTMETLLKIMQVYKVGDLYLTTNTAEPQVTLGYGTWVRFGEGRALVGVSTNPYHPDWTKGVASQHGAYEHSLTVSEMPSHNHDLLYNTSDIGGSGFPATDNNSDTTSYIKTEYQGGGIPHNNVQPSITVFVWRRVA